MPSNIEAEQAVLGSLLLSKEKYFGKLKNGFQTMRIDRKFNKFQWIIYASIVKIRIVQETLEPTVIVVSIRNNNFKDAKRDTYTTHFYYKTIAVAFRRKQIPRIGNTNRTQAERNNVICRLRETILKIRSGAIVVMIAKFTIEMNVGESPLPFERIYTPTYHFLLMRFYYMSIHL